MYMVFGIVVGLVVLCFAIGWLIPLIVGIVKLRRGQRQIGIALTITGGIWGLAAVGLIALAAFLGRGQMFDYQVKDFEPSKYEGLVGRIVVPCDGEVELFLSGDGDEQLRLKVGDQSAQAPAKRLRLESYTISATADDGSRWKLYSHFYGREQSITVEPNADVKLKIGPPFRAKLDVDLSNNRANIGLSVSDTAGGDCSLFRMDSDAPVGFVALTRSGDKLWEGKLESG